MSHARFAARHGLKFPLIDDTDGIWATAFGVRLRLGMASRVTFVLGRDEKIAKIYPSVNPGVHATEVLAAVRTLH